MIRWQAVLGLAAALAFVPAISAQQFTPHVGYVFPAGGRQGTTFQVTVGGQYLDGATTAFVSGSGVQAKIVKLVKPLTNQQMNKFRDQLKELAEKRAAASKRGATVKWTPEDEKTGTEIRTTMASIVFRPANPSIAELVTVEVTMAPEAAPGERELRLTTPGGLTNPLVFCVGQLPEFSKAPAKPRSEFANFAFNSQRYGSLMKNNLPETPAQVTLPAILNGQIVPGAVDRYRFQANKGQHLVIAAGVRELIPYISDAVPGWFQASLALYDANGKEVNYADHYGFHQDPVLYYEIPKDGEYTLAIRDSIYRGREDFVYRVELGELPFVTSIFPLGGKAGAQTTVQMKGWNLPVSSLTENAKDKGTGVYPISVRKGEWVSNRVPFAVDALPEVLDKEPNNLARKAQKVKLPIIVNGRIDRPGDWDVFRFDGRAGDEIVAEVVARRLDSPLDSALKLTDSKGRQVAANDDYDDKGAGLITHQADSRISIKLPAKGTYYLHLGDTQGKGGAEYAYRLRIAHPQPDFELRVAPSSISVRAGMTVPITVYALRKDGFEGEISLKLKDAPAGFKLSGGVVPANQDKVRLTLTAPQARMDQPFKLQMEGSSMVQGRAATRPAVPAEYMEQAFAYHHLVPEDSWMVRVVGSGRTIIPWRLPGETVKLTAGGTVPVHISVPLGRMTGQIQLSLNDPPEGVSIQKVSSAVTGLAVDLRVDAAKAKPGLRGNLIVDAFTEQSFSPGQGRPKIKRRVPLGTLPAIPFEIVGTVQARQ